MTIADPPQSSAADVLLGLVRAESDDWIRRANLTGWRFEQASYWRSVAQLEAMALPLMREARKLLADNRYFLVERDEHGQLVRGTEITDHVDG